MDAGTAQDVIWLALTLILAAVLTVILLLWRQTADVPITRD